MELLVGAIKDDFLSTVLANNASMEHSLMAWLVFPALDSNALIPFLFGTG